MADVTKDLLIKISTEGNAETAINGASSATDGFLGKMVGLNQAWELFNKVIGVATAGLGYAYEGLKALTDTASKFEQINIKFETIFGDAGSAQKAIDWAAEFAATTPLTLEQVTSAMMRLKAYGFDPMNGSLESIGNAAFALGGDFNGIVLALGQMELRGKVVQQELNQLTNQNVPAAKWLREELGLTAEAMGDIGNQAVDAGRAVEIILRKFDEHYGGSLKKAGDSWKGALTTISDTWTLFERAIMDAGPFKFMVENIREVRDVFYDFTKSDSGFNTAFRLGVRITEQFVYWKDVLASYVMPHMDKIAKFALDTATAFGVVWNLTVDIAGWLGGPFLAGVWGIVTGVAAWSKEIDGFFKKFRAESIEMFTAFVYNIGRAAIYVEEFWLRFVRESKEAFYDLKISFATTMLEMLDSPLMTVMKRIYGIGDDEIAASEAMLFKMYNSAKDQRSKIADEMMQDRKTVADHRDLWADFIMGSRKDLYSWAGVLDILKVNVADPLGLKSLMTDLPKEGRLLWEEGMTGSLTSGKTLYERGVTTFENLPTKGDKIPSNYAIPDYDPNRQKSGGLDVKFSTSDGDELLNLLVNRLNKAVLASGTIGAGF